MGFLKLYTREAERIYYPSAVAQSVHISVSFDGESYLPLNQNYGVLFPKAAVRENNTIDERGVLNPLLFRRDDGYGIIADLVNARGESVEDGEAYLWYTDDFITFDEVGIVCKNSCPEAASDTIAVTTEMLCAIIDRWTPLHCVGLESPGNIKLSSLAELDSVRAIARYSDGSTDDKKVAWDKGGAVKNADGSYTISGTAEITEFDFPIIRYFADPVVYKYDGKYYFIATNNVTNCIGIYVSCADTPEALFAPDNKLVCILPYDEASGFIQAFWAPEFHIIGGELYILFAVSNHNWAPQSHMMKLKRGGDIMNADSWEHPVRVQKADGSVLCDRGITLDMTYLKSGGRSYLLWSERYHIGTPLDSGSMIYIAPIDESEPYRLTGEPVLLTRPLYGWENQDGTINNEGPHPLILGDKIYIAYSGGSSGGYTYVISYLVSEAGKDLLDPASWVKTPSPMLSAYSIKGLDGPGHNAFYKDDDGKIMITYHAKRADEKNTISAMIHRVHLDKNGFPRLDMSAERDLPKHMRSVSARVTLE